MKFEVNVEANLEALHRARIAYNAQHGDPQALDMPSFVQRLIEQAIAQALAPLGPITLADALSKIAELEVANAALELQVKPIPIELAKAG